MTDHEPKLADHVDKSVEAIVQVHREHDRSVGALQRSVERLTGLLAQPTSILAAIGAVAAWIAFNLWIAAHGGHPPDPPPFGWLELVTTVAGFILASLILATQKREDRIEKQRSQLTLELALLSDQKTAKLIALIEELRRDTPTVTDRVDAESTAMSKPADAQSVLDALKERSDEAPPQQ
jgi:uncharacterized membrane protein